MVYLYVSSPTLRHLMLDFVFCGCSKHVILLDTPTLQYLKVVDPISIFISAPKLKSLVEAEICLLNCSFQGEFINQRISTQFFECFSDVKCLTISSGGATPPMYARLLAAATRFNYLTKLDWIADRHFLPGFLRSANMLELLIIRKVDCYLKGWVEPNYVPLCLSSRIRIVSIYAFEGRESEYDMVRYILRTAEALKQINIYSECVKNDTDYKFRMLQRISRLPQASEMCKIFFC